MFVARIPVFLFLSLLAFAVPSVTQTPSGKEVDPAAQPCPSGLIRIPTSYGSYCGKANSSSVQAGPDVCCTVLPDILPKRLIELAGDGAVDCGHVLLHGSSEKANSCARKAVRNKTPFYISYELQGIDSWVAAGLARDSRGNLYELQFDSMGMSLSGQEKRNGMTLSDGNHIAIMVCPKPLQLHFFPRATWLTCFPVPKRLTPLH